MSLRKIYHWDCVAGDPELRTKYQAKINLLMTGQTQAADLDLKKLSKYRIYTIRLNKRDRLLLTTVVINNKKCLVVLEAIYNHDYTKSRFLKPGVIERFLDANESVLAAQITEEDFKAETKIDIDIEPASEADTFEHVTIEYFNQKFIELSGAQKEVLRSSLPAVVTGPPGSGKSCTLMAILKQCAQNSQHKKPILCVTQSPILLDILKQQWLDSPTLTDDIKNRVVFKTNDQLLHEINNLTGYTRADTEVIEQWLVDYIAKNKNSKTAKDLPHDFFDRKNEILQEFRIICSFDEKNREGYLKLGRRQCIFHTAEEKYWIWQAYHACIKNLDKSKLYHPAFTSSMAKDLYSCIVVDEAQDMSTLELILLAKLAEFCQICYCMDSHQSLTDCMSKVPFLLSFILSVTGQVHKPIKLPYTYRCPENIALLVI